MDRDIRASINKCSLRALTICRKSLTLRTLNTQKGPRKPYLMDFRVHNSP
jgi:hypothetical protein